MKSFKRCPTLSRMLLNCAARHPLAFTHLWWGVKLSHLKSPSLTLSFKSPPPFSSYLPPTPHVPCRWVWPLKTELVLTLGKQRGDESVYEQQWLLVNMPGPFPLVFTWKKRHSTYTLRRILNPAPNPLQKRVETKTVTQASSKPHKWGLLIISSHLLT